MSFRTDLLKRVGKIRKDVFDKYDIRTSQLTIRIRTWDGPEINQGTYSDVDLVLPPHFAIRGVSGEEVVSSGGRYRLDDVTVNHITPANDGVEGYTPEQLAPRHSENNVETLYIITGPEGGEYELVESKFLRPFSYGLVLRRTRRTP